MLCFVAMVRLKIETKEIEIQWRQRMNHFSCNISIVFTLSLYLSNCVLSSHRIDFDVYDIQTDVEITHFWCFRLMLSGQQKLNSVENRRATAAAAALQNIFRIVVVSTWKTAKRIIPPAEFRKHNRFVIVIVFCVGTRACGCVLGVCVWS